MHSGARDGEGGSGGLKKLFAVAKRQFKKLWQIMIRLPKGVFTLEWGVPRSDPGVVSVLRP